jgi:rhodanese-related sulfurtransferase
MRNYIPMQLSSARLNPMSMSETLEFPAVVPPHTLAELLSQRPDVRLLDVRTPAEYETAHIRGAYNVPLDRLAEHGAEIRASVTAPVVLICQSGQRARKAESALRAAGMPNLHVLEGGVAAWSGVGNPLVRGAERVSLERQVRMVAGAIVALGAFLALGVHPFFALIPAVIGSGLVFAGVSNTCMMGMLLARLPYNRPATCDVGAMVRALLAGAGPDGSMRSASVGDSCTAR